jgi:hypothetical protein
MTFLLLMFLFWFDRARRDLKRHATQHVLWDFCLREPSASKTGGPGARTSIQP